ncbi:MAG: bifunctional hydroxymethylpyrimidine kinase/phosphomethylpyrimidine kinase [Methanomassiliicoccales archaeon]|nr:bifunctional hydroxymethylpyrimidine kinase/phosphomethylpyrimidine kinase [Methanomassiliicoccales archaeon]
MSIAGSDSIGGAGIQADVKAMASVGVHAATVITAVTSQNTRKVVDILPVPPAHVASQLDSVLSDADVRAAKTGMLYSPDIVRTVAGRLRRRKLKLVVDPVMIAGVGDTLSSEGLVDSIRKDLLPLATIVAPNREEAEAISGMKVSSLKDARRACARMIDLGSEMALVKGGHFGGSESVDVLFDGKEFVELRSPRVAIKVHGSGCALSAYIAAYLALGTEPREAVVQAKERITDAIEFHHRIGKGLEATQPMATSLMEMARYSVMTTLKEATEALEGFLTVEWIPEVGTNFAYALPHARYSEDVCALEGRIVGLRGRAIHSGCYSFGASRHVARIVLEAMRHDPAMRSVINVRFSEEHIRALKKARLSLASFERKDEPPKMKTMEWGTRSAIESVGAVPDVIFDRGGVGKEPMIRILGKDPQDVVRKLRGAIHQGVA